MINYKNIPYSADLPYPLVLAKEKNINYARWMLDNAGGSNSEISAVSLYFYNNIMTDAYKDISYIFHKISIVEMHHLEIFGKLALQLGEDPRLWTNLNKRKIYWSPGYNSYPLQLGELINNALDGELAAIRKYESQLCAISDQNITDNLKRIIIDEKIHVNIFKDIINEYNL